MSCSARVKKCGGRRVDNNNSNNNNRRSLLFLLGSDGGGMSNNSASAWFHNSLQHLSHSWHRFNKFGISRDKKADRCSTWFVDQTDNNNKTLPFFSFPRLVGPSSPVVFIVRNALRLLTFKMFIYIYLWFLFLLIIGEPLARNPSTSSTGFQRSANEPTLKGFRPDDEALS